MGAPPFQGYKPSRTGSLLLRPVGARLSLLSASRSYCYRAPARAIKGGLFYLPQSPSWPGGGFVNRVTLVRIQPVAPLRSADIHAVVQAEASAKGKPEIKAIANPWHGDSRLRQSDAQGLSLPFGLIRGLDIHAGCAPVLHLLGVSCGARPAVNGVRDAPTAFFMLSWPNGRVAVP